MEIEKNAESLLKEISKNVIIVAAVKTGRIEETKETRLLKKYNFVIANGVKQSRNNLLTN